MDTPGRHGGTTSVRACAGYSLAIRQGGKPLFTDPPIYQFPYDVTAASVGKSRAAARRRRERRRSSSSASDDDDGGFISAMREQLKNKVPDVPRVLLQQVGEDPAERWRLLLSCS